MGTVLWVILGLAVGATVGFLLGAVLSLGKRSALEDENWRLRRDLIRWQNQRLDV